MYPYECRLRSLTYAAPLYATVCRKIDDEPQEKITIPLGDIPLMVRSANCNLAGLSEEELVRKHEDMHEWGGYFIVNGNERLLRMLIVNKRNYPVCFERSSFCNRGRFFSPFAVQMRCVRDDLFSQTLTIHYLTDGNCVLKFIYQKQEFLVPIYVLLKALAPCSGQSDGSTDAYIYNRLVKGYFQNRQISDKVEVMLADGNKLGLYSQEQCLAYLGSRLRTVLEGVTVDMSDSDVGRFLLERVLLVHCSAFKDKFNTLCLMVEKLYAFVAGECTSDNLDATSNQEVLLGGHTYVSLMAEKLYDLLLGARAKLMKDLKNPKFDVMTIRNPNYLKKLMDS
jgi:DNA-directed RNA polymerase I subunit RPA2